MNACMKDTQQLVKPYTFNQRVETLFKSYFANHQNAKIKINDKEELPDELGGFSL